MEVKVVRDVIPIETVYHELDERRDWPYTDYEFLNRYIQ